MAKRGDRLPYCTLREPAPTITLSDVDWRELEMEVTKVINFGSRLKFVAILNLYLEDDAFERAAVRTNDVARSAKAMLEALQPFISFAFGGKPAFANRVDVPAWREFEEQLEDRLSHRTIAARSTVDGPLDLRVVPALSLISEVASELTVALNSIAGSPVPKEFEHHPGIEIGAAFDNLLLASKTWAKDASLPYGPLSTSGGAAPFAAFMFAVWVKLPVDSRPSVASPEAMAERIRVANRGK